TDRAGVADFAGSIKCNSSEAVARRTAKDGRIAWNIQSVGTGGTRKSCLPIGEKRGDPFPTGDGATNLITSVQIELQTRYDRHQRETRDNNRRHTRGVEFCG